MTRPLVLVALLASTAVGCAPDDRSTDTSTPAPAVDGAAADPRTEGTPAAVLGDLEVFRPWVQLQAGTGALYLTVRNVGAQPDRLVAVETASAVVAELHETVDDGGVMRMSAHPDGFPIPPAAVLALAPGGKHVMLIEPRLAEGESGLAASLVFERSGRLDIVAPVLEAGAFLAGGMP